MRVFSIFIVSCFSFCTQTHEKKSFVSIDFKNIDSLTTLSRLFDYALIKDGQILWSPGYQDITVFSRVISSDSLCHTSIDTIIALGSTHYVVFRTDRYVEDTKDDCHSCSPIVGIASFEKTGDHFQLKQFVKNVFQFGSFGEYGQLEIDDLCVAALKISSGWSGTGAEIQYEAYYDLHDFSKLFYLTTLSSNGGMFEKGQPNYYETVKSITDKTDSSFIIETTKLFFDSLGKKTEIKYKDEVRVFNEVGGQEFEMKRL